MDSEVASSLIDWMRPPYAVIVAVVAYAVVFTLARRRMVAGPHRTAVVADLATLRAEVALADLDAARRDTLLQVLEDADVPTGWLWNGERELGAAMRMAAVRRLLIEAYTDLDVQARLHYLPVCGRVDLTRAQRDEALAVVMVRDSEAMRRRRRTLLRELEYEPIRRSLASYRSTLALHRKSWWMTLVALGAILSVGLAYPFALAPMLAGGVGGFLATVFRFTRARKVPRQYQNSWAVIFLAAPVGALGGIVSVVLLAALNAIQVAGTVFGSFGAYLASGEVEHLAIVTAIAFVGGFSARFTERLAERLGGSFDTPTPATPPSTGLDLLQQAGGLTAQTLTPEFEFTADGPATARTSTNGRRQRNGGHESEQILEVESR